MGEKLEGSWKRAFAVVCAVICALFLSLGAVKSGYASDTSEGASSLQSTPEETSSSPFSKVDQGSASQKNGDSATNNGGPLGSPTQLSTNADNDGDITKMCVITFWENAGEGNVNPEEYNTQEVKANTPFPLEGNKYQRVGYYFDGWSLTRNGSAINVEELQKGIEDDLDLYVVWTPYKEYIVSYDANGGTGVVESQIVHVKNIGDSEKLTLRENTFERLGHRFVEWNTKRDGSGKGYGKAPHNGVEDVTTSSSTVLYAQWVELKAGVDGKGYAPERHTLTLDGHGGTPSEYEWSISDGTSIKLTCPFTYSGYMFAGWLDDPNATVPVYQEGQVVPITKDLKLYAKWTPSSSNKLEVTFDDGYGRELSQEFAAGVSTRLPLYSELFTTSPATDKTFAGWEVVNVDPVNQASTTQSQSSNLNVQSTVYKGEDLADGQYVTLTGNARLEAQWVPSNDITTYSVTFMSNPLGQWGQDKYGDEVGETSYKQQAEKNIATVLTSNSFFNPGYTFVGWNTKRDGRGNAYNEGDAIVCSSDTVLYAQWSAGEENVNVIYNSNIGTESTIRKQIVPINTESELVSNTFERDGYLFKYWNTSESGSGRTYTNGEHVALQNDLYLYAQWVQSISFNSNEGTGEMESIPITQTKKLPLPTVRFKRSGYDFDSWNTRADGNGYKYTNIIDDTTILSTPITLYAQWTKNSGDSYTVTYESNGASGSAPSAQTVDKGESVTVKTKGDLTKSDADFVEWNTASDGSGTGYDPGDSLTPTDNMKLYAIWSDSPTTKYTVTYNGNGASGSAPSAQTVDKGDSVTVQQKGSLKKSGATFVEWNTASDGSGTGYNPGDTLTPTSYMTLYAIWSDSSTTYTVTYNKNGGSGNVPSTQTVAKGGSITVQEKGSLTKSGATFVEWNTSSSGKGTGYDPGDSLKPTKNMTLYAIWSDSSTKYTVTYSANGGTGNMESQSGTAGTQITVKSNAFKRSGYTFENWKGSDGNTYKSGDKITLSKNITLSAQWKSNNSSSSSSSSSNSTNKVTVTFYPNGGAGSMSSQSMTANTSTNLKSNTFSRTGYTFKNWNTKSDGTGTSYSNGQSVRLSSDLTLYAQWTEGSSTDKNSSSSTSRTSGSTSNTGSTSSSGTSGSTTSSSGSNTATRTTPGATAATTTTTDSTGERGNLATTGDPTSYVPIIIAAVAGIALVAAAIYFRTKNR